MRRAQGRSVWKGRGRWGWGRADTGPLLAEPRAACGRGKGDGKPGIEPGTPASVRVPPGPGGKRRTRGARLRPGKERAGGAGGPLPLRHLRRVVETLSAGRTGGHRDE